MAQLSCIVVTPENTAIETTADYVVLPLYDGEIGIASGRAPLIGRLGYGEMRLKIGQEVVRYYLDGGFAQVVDNVVSVLTDRAIPASDIDTEAARQQLNDALKMSISSPDREQVRERQLKQARAQIHIAQRS